MGNQIEGEIKAGQKAVVIEDLISTGKSSMEAVVALQAAGVEVIGLCSIFTYGFPQAEQVFADAGIKTVSLSNYAALIDTALQRELISANQVAMLSEWRENPAVWGK
jgi:orotate phosphoribosyltransferase